MDTLFKNHAKLNGHTLIIALISINVSNIRSNLLIYYNISIKGIIIFNIGIGNVLLVNNKTKFKHEYPNEYVIKFTYYN
jgi:hypothetical protein